MASAISNVISNWFARLARSRIVLEHPDDPEDERVLHLFRNRAEMKKALGDAQDEAHRLKDRIKLQGLIFTEKSFAVKGIDDKGARLFVCSDTDYCSERFNKGYRVVPSDLMVGSSHVPNGEVRKCA